MIEIPEKSFALHLCLTFTIIFLLLNWNNMRWSLQTHRNLSESLPYLNILFGANYTSQSPSVSESASASEYSSDRKVPIGLCASSYIYQPSSVIFPDIHPHPNFSKLYPFSMRIQKCEGSLNRYNFLIYGSIFALKVSFFSALTAACSTGRFMFNNF